MLASSAYASSHIPWPSDGWPVTVTELQSGSLIAQMGLRGECKVALSAAAGAQGLLQPHGAHPEQQQDRVGGADWAVRRAAEAPGASGEVLPTCSAHMLQSPASEEAFGYPLAHCQGHMWL